MENKEALKEERDKLRQLHRKALDIYDSEDKKECCKVTIEAGEGVLSLETCGICLSEDKNPSPGAFSTELGKEKERKLIIDRSLALKTVEEGEIFWGNKDDIPDITFEGEDIRSIISIPIGEFGAFQATSTSRDSFNQQDVDLAKLLTEHLEEALERIELEEELRELSTRDPLTNLYNRRYFNETLRKEVERSKRNDYRNGFLMIDVNRFKEINDRYSHQTGDRVLKAVAQLLKENVRSTDTVVRYGGDEFLIMLVEADHGINATADRLRKAVKEWNEQSSLLDFPLTLAIGLTSWGPDQNLDVESALKEADKKMYEDKKS